MYIYIHTCIQVWTLEECLVSKDTELTLKEAELSHLRYLINSQRADSSSQSTRSAAAGSRKEALILENRFSEIGSSPTGISEGQTSGVRFSDDRIQPGRPLPEPGKRLPGIGTSEPQRSSPGTVSSSAENVATTKVHICMYVCMCVCMYV
jgi:hypothetical protein